ncbi:hypothetical protein E3N88_07407 [Mikania micrantha]|uniref:No apical meristem-associated C-terminal domain-containing protein n=1 Tax=Mikania micrantha TaxID=192012 RepID=A0A5N6PS55_9ASTR|nr:hypothetical protein E3N88_07407 [Mikania micrantha]
MQAWELVCYNSLWCDILTVGCQSQSTTKRLKPNESMGSANAQINLDDDEDVEGQHDRDGSRIYYEPDRPTRKGKRSAASSSSQEDLIQQMAEFNSFNKEESQQRIRLREEKLHVLQEEKEAVTIAVDNYGINDVESMQEMMNVGENRARNGVLNSPKSKNEEKSRSIELRGSSWCAKAMLRILGAMANPPEHYIYQRFPYVILDDTPSSSSGSDSDPSEASVATSHAVPQVAATPPQVPHTPPRHPHVTDEDTSAGRRESPPPQTVAVWDGLRRMRGQARKTTGLPPRRQLAPRDEPKPMLQLILDRKREIAAR